MIRFFREIRLIPIVLFATVALFALKTIGLLADGRYTLGSLIGAADPAEITGTIPARTLADEPGPTGVSKQLGQTKSWAQQMFGYPDVTGAVDEAKKTDAPPPDAKAAAKTATKPEEPPKGPAGWKPVSVEPGRRSSPAEQAILERLQERRSELDGRAKELEMRESLLKAAEKRVEARVSELKGLEARANGKDKNSPVDLPKIEGKPTVN